MISCSACPTGKKGYDKLIDRADFPRHKLCGDTLNPGSLAILDRLGLGDRVRACALPISGMVVTGPRGYVPGDYVGLASDGADFVSAFTVTNDLGWPVAFPQDNNGVFVDSHDRQSIMFVR